MIRRREKEKNEFSLIISLELLINQSVWGCGGVLSVTVITQAVIKGFGIPHILVHSFVLFLS